ncbi:MAG: nuclear transport factor 2 family protein [Phycisphaerales bacterium]|nr:nuclear transport factor 2 family protein [Phycisphaerales bacterium]
MAKKSKKPAVKKFAPKATKKPAAKKSAKPAGASKLAPKPVSSGKGATPAEIGAAVVAHLNSGAVSDTPLWDKFWSDAIESIEGSGMGWAGRKAMEAKCADFMGENEILGCRATGPFVGATGFAVHIEIELKPKGGDTVRMKEVAVYTVKNGKVVREEFMYAGC